MPDRFSSVLLKVEWARKHIDHLHSEIMDFWSQRPYAIEIVGDPKNGKGSYRIKGDPPPLPDSLTLAAGDASHNLRAALDHFACAAVTTVTPSTAFPVWRPPRTPSATDWRGLVFGKLRGAPQPLIDEVIKLEVYNGGAGQDIWAIDELDRTDKHRLLIAVAGANTGIVIDFGEVMAATFPELSSRAPMPSLPLSLRPEWTPVEKEAELLTVQDEKGFKAEPTFTFDVALAAPDVLQGEPVVKVLRHLADEAETLLNRLIPLA
jgi:hypothetical protein